MRCKIFIASILYSFASFASIPTVEGLFRNAHNAEIDGNTAAVSFTIESIPDIQKNQDSGMGGMLLPVGEEKNEEDDAFEKKTGYYKLIFTLEEDRATPMLQVRYRGVGMSPSEVADTFVVPDLDSHIRREKVLEKQFFYSLIQMFVLNSSSGFNSLLKKEVQNYRSNKDLIAPEKKRLYERYMTYLKRVKELEDNEEELEKLESPLKPEDEEEKKKVEKIQSRRFYGDYGNVKLTREGEKFFWSVDLMGLEALFTQEEHRLKKLRLETLQGGLEVSVANYVLMDGRHELPQKVIMDHPEYGRYQVTFMSTQDFESKSTSFTDRVKEYRDWQEDNLEKKSQEQKESLSVIPYMY